MDLEQGLVRTSALLRRSLMEMWNKGKDKKLIVTTVALGLLLSATRYVVTREAPANKACARF